MEIAMLENTVSKRWGTMTEENSITADKHRLVTVCCICQRLKTSDGGWEECGSTLTQIADEQISHAFCPDCVRIHYPSVLAPEND